MDEDLKTQQKVEKQLDHHNDKEEDMTNQELGFEQHDQQQQETIPNGHLTFKLKITKPETEISTSVGNEYSRVCEFCGKGFSNGKALGGHMRMHYQQQKNQNQKLFLVQNIHKSTDFGNNADLVSPVCSVCGKKFPSKKSLFGHMRSHPGRAWRGINPPSNSIAKNSTSSSTLSDSEPPTDQPLISQKFDHYHQIDSAEFDDDHDTSVPKWSVTGKRGRKRKSSSDFLPSSDDRMNEAAHHLLMLASSDPKPLDSSNHYTTKSGEPKVALPQSNSENKTQIFDSLKKVKKGKEKADLESNEELFTEKFLPLILEEEYSDTHNSERSELGNSKKKARRKLKLDEPEETGYDNINEEDQMEKKKKKKNSVRCEYRCNKCGKTFQTHQALGGHTASHNKNQRITNKNSAKSSISAMEEDRPRVVLNFDLNDFPPMEDEQGIDH